MNEPSSKRKAARHVSIYALGSIIRQLVGFIMLPVYTSYLSPSDYGVVSLLVVMVSLCEVLIGARFGQAMPKFFYEQADSEWRNTVVSTALLVTACISVLVTLLVIASSNPISSLLFGTGNYSDQVSLYSILLLTMAIESYGLIFFRLQERPWFFMANSVCKMLIQLSLNIWLVVFEEMGVMGVIVSSIVSSAVFALFAAVYIVWHTGLRFSKELTVRFFRFSWPLWLAGIAGLYIGSSNRFFIRIFSDLDQVGLFELATKFSMILALLVWQPFSQWWQTEKFKLFNSADQGASVFPVVYNGITLVLVFCAIGITLFGDIVIQIMSDNAFHPAADAIVFLVYAQCIKSLTMFFTFSFMVKEKTIITSYLSYGSAAVITACYFVFIPQYGFVGAALSQLIANSLLFFITVFLARRVFDSGIKIKYSLFVVFVSIIFAGMDWYLKSHISGLTDLVLTKLLLVCILMAFLGWCVWINPPLFRLFKDLYSIIFGRLIGNGPSDKKGRGS
jgi:O-antigen/teichoic acid export membrane protein